MAKNRERQRNNKKIEQKLDAKNIFGVSDPTPRAAVCLIINHLKRTEV